MARKKRTPKKPNPHKPYIKGFWKLFSLGVFTVFGVFLLASIGALGEMPDFRQLENPETNLATQILSSDNQVLGKFYFKDNRTPIQFDELPQNMIDALIATEDERYYDHSGIDLRGTLRAVVFLGERGGASTISQQLARQFVCWSTLSKYVSSCFSKNKRMGNCHSIGASVHQRRNHNDVPQHL